MLLFAVVKVSCKGLVVRLLIISDAELAEVDEGSEGSVLSYECCCLL